jgi:hypothetical protein
MFSSTSSKTFIGIEIGASVAELVVHLLFFLKMCSLDYYTLFRDFAPIFENKC